MLSVAAGGLTLAALGVIYKVGALKRQRIFIWVLSYGGCSSVLVLCSGVGVWRAICAVYSFHFSVAFCAFNQTHLPSKKCTSAEEL